MPFTKGNKEHLKSKRNQGATKRSLPIVKDLIQEALNKNKVDLFDRLIRMLNQRSTSPSNKILIMNSLLDRMYGKAVQQVDLDANINQVNITIGLPEPEEPKEIIDIQKEEIKLIEDGS